MRKTFLHIALLTLLVLSGCLKDKKAEEQKKWTVTMDHTDKRPYGAYLAYESLKYCFPDAKTQILSPGFRYTNMDNEMKYNSEGRSLLVLQGFNFFLSEIEWYELKRFVNDGNEVVIFCSILDEKIEKELNMAKRQGGEETNNYYTITKESNNTNVLSIKGPGAKKYGYTGHSIKGFFVIETDTVQTKTDSTKYITVGDSTYASADPPSDADTAHPYARNNNDEDNTTTSSSDGVVWTGPDTLGYGNGHPNFIRYASGDGHITFHAAPLALSNYFLLQRDNKDYLSAVWQTLPANINRIYWSDYYSRSNEASSTGILLRYPATKLALWLGMFTLLMYILFEGKRKQRIIPIIEPLKNDSVSFVETVGRLYYNKRNQGNLAEKMMQQFLEWVRIHYLLNTNLLNDAFVQQLTIKSGQPEATVRAIVDMIHEIRLKDVAIDDAYLYQLYNTIQQFYKNHRI